MAIAYTDNFKLPLPPFGTTPWQQYYRDLVYILDGVIARYVGVQNFKGAWQNSTQYTTADKLLDIEDGVIYIALSTHTSAASGTSFTEDRVLRPGLWTPYSVAGVARGTWAAGQTYAANDFVVSGTKYAVCLVSHTSSSSFTADAAAGRWGVLVDLTGFVPITIPVPINEGGTNATTASAARANLGLAIGSNVQAYSATLAVLATTTPATDVVPYYTGAGSASTTALTAHGRALLSGANAAATFATLGISSFAQTYLDEVDAASTRGVLSAAPRDPQHLTLATNSELANERVFTPGTALTAVDGGAGAAYTLNVDTLLTAGFLRGYLAGLRLSNGTDATNDIDIAVGSAVNRDNTHLMVLSSGLTKQLDAAWAVGTNAGGRDTGSIANGTWHLHLIQRSDTGVVDAIYSLSPDTSSVVTITIASPGVVTWVGHGLVNGASVKFSTTGALPTGLTAGTTYFVVSAAADTFQVSATQGGASINTSGSQSGVHTAQATPVMPTNYDRFRRIGSVLRESATIIPFVQDGDYFQRGTFLQAWNSVNPGTSAVTRTLGVPVGINVIAQVNWAINSATSGLSHIYVYLSDLATTDSAAVQTLADGATGEDAGTGLMNGNGNKLVRTNTSAQIRSRLGSSDGTLTFTGNTLAWFDSRGRNA